MKNASPKTLAWYKDVERVFGSMDVQNIRSSLRQLIQALLENGNKPVSVNSWLTGIRAYLMWLYLWWPQERRQAIVQDQGHRSPQPLVLAAGDSKKSLGLREVD